MGDSSAYSSCLLSREPVFDPEQRALSVVSNRVDTIFLF